MKMFWEGSKNAFGIQWEYIRDVLDMGKLDSNGIKIYLKSHEITSVLDFKITQKHLKLTDFDF